MLRAAALYATRLRAFRPPACPAILTACLLLALTEMTSAATTLTLDAEKSQISFGPNGDVWVLADTVDQRFTASHPITAPDFVVSPNVSLSVAATELASLRRELVEARASLAQLQATVSELSAEISGGQFLHTPLPAKLAIVAAALRNGSSLAERATCEATCVAFSEALDGHGMVADAAARAFVGFAKAGG